MAHFRVGQRVKVIAFYSPFNNSLKIIGEEGTILFFQESFYPVEVQLDEGTRGPFMECELAPLSDPRAEEFIADMERFSILSKERTNPWNSNQ